MTVLQLLIIRNYSRRIIGFLCVNWIFIRSFDIGPDPTRPTRDGPGVSRTRNLLVTSPILYQLDHCTHNPDPTRLVGGPDPYPTLHVTIQQ